MALISCPDCGRDVSDIAPVCLNCGRPIAVIQTSPQVATIRGNSPLSQAVVDRAIEMVHQTTISEASQQPSGSYVVRILCTCGWNTDFADYGSAELVEIGAEAVAERHRERPARASDSGETTIFLVSLLFGIFGLIPAAVYANNAAREGKPSGQYWAAFAMGLTVAAILWVIVVVALIGH